LISIFELCRGMWTYNTLAAAVKAGTRYAVVHGQNCAVSGNTCTVTIAQIAGQMQAAGPGLPPDQPTLTFPSSTGSAVTCSMPDCLSTSPPWPLATAYSVGNDVAISGTYPFRSIISMLWPSAGSVGRFGAVNFGAASREQIQF